MSLLTAPAFAQDVAAGIEAYQRRDYETALAAWQPLAERGDAGAQASIGLLYARGHGVSQDYDEAIKWFRLSAAQGYAIAQNNLGVMYRNGYGVQQDYAQALMHYRLSAAQGYALAQSSLGSMYENGDGTRRDYEEAYMWYTLAADQGHRRAAHARVLLAPLMSAEQRRKGIARAQQRQTRHALASTSKLSEIPSAGPSAGPSTGNAPVAQRVAITPPPEVKPAAPTSPTPPTPLSSPAEIDTKTPPAATPNTAEPLPALTESAAWRVQLVALRSEADADAVWSELQLANQDLLDGLELHVQLAELSQGTFYRIQAGPLADRATAASLCDTLKTRRQDCIIVAP
jgi:cell division septation protein DedD